MSLFGVVRTGIHLANQKRGVDRFVSGVPIVGPVVFSIGWLVSPLAWSWWVLLIVAMDIDTLLAIFYCPYIMLFRRDVGTAQQGHAVDDRRQRRSRLRGTDVGQTRMTRHEVILILEPLFDGDLWDLSRRAHVWIAGTAENTAVARAVWDRQADHVWPMQGVTTFHQHDDATTLLYTMLETVDEHHGERSAAVPWQAIHVRGLPLDAVSESRIVEELGGMPIRLMPEGAGFAIVRAGQPAAAAARG